MPLLLVPIQLVSLPSLSSPRAGEVQSRGESLEGDGEPVRPPLQFSKPPLHLSVLLRTTAFEFKSQECVVFLLWLHRDKSPLTQNGSPLFLCWNVGKGHKMKWRVWGEWFHYYAMACCCCEQALILKFHPFYSWLSTVDTLLLGKGLRVSTSGSLGPGWNPAQRIPGVAPHPGERCAWTGRCTAEPSFLLFFHALLFPFFFLFYAPSLTPSHLSFEIKPTHGKTHTFSVHLSEWYPCVITRVLPFYKKRWL